MHMKNELKVANEINNALEHRLYDGIEIIRELSKIIHRKQSRLCRLFLRVCYMEDVFRGMILER